MFRLSWHSTLHVSEERDRVRPVVVPRLDSQELLVVGGVPAAALNAAELLDLEFDFLHFSLYRVLLAADHRRHIFIVLIQILR